MSDRLAALVVLAAGQGTRMRSATPKVLFQISGRTLLGHVLSATAPLAAGQTRVVVGHAREAVEAELAAIAPDAVPVHQPTQNGTGHAVRLALAEAVLDDDATVLVVAGDTPLLTTPTLSALLTARGTAGAAVLTAHVADPTGYGRVTRDGYGGVSGIVEERDASVEQRAITEINTGVYAFAAGPLRAALDRLGTDNAQGEEYLTDVIGQLVDAGLGVAAILAPDAAEVAGVNDRVQLAAAGAAMRRRLLEQHMRAGVTVVDPLTTYVDCGVLIEADVVLHPGTTLRGSSSLERGAQVGPHATLTDTVVRAGATVIASTCTGADIGPGATVGPYSYLRPGTRLGRRAKVGAYVETKAATVGDDAKVPHLSYVGDASVGARSNIGAGTIVVNYDGVAKHRTSIGSDVRVGSNNSLVAPVTIGDGAYTAAGSAITMDVPAGSLGVGRARQRIIAEWVARRRPTATGDSGPAGTPATGEPGRPGSL